MAPSQAPPVARIRSDSCPRVILAALSALCGALLATTAGRIGSVGSPIATATAPEEVVSPCSENPTDPNSCIMRSRLASAYLARWYARADAHGMVHIRSREIHSCYNVLTQKGLPTPPAEQRQRRKHAGEDKL